MVMIIASILLSSFFKTYDTFLTVLSSKGALCPPFDLWKQINALVEEGNDRNSQTEKALLTLGYQLYQHGGLIKSSKKGSD